MADPTPSEVARDRRANIESEYNKQKADREGEFVAAREALEHEYHEDIKAIDQAKREAFLAEGLNSDGKDPQGRPQG